MKKLTILPPKNNTTFRVLNNRLVLLHEYQNHHDYWGNYWYKSEYTKSLIDKGKKGELGEIKGIISKFVNKQQLILEAGCGPGHLVAALSANGFNAMGIEYQTKVVEFAKQFLPDERITKGNVLFLDLPDNSIGCYLSIGVAEHFIEGPEVVLQEARRVIRKDGVALISVPYLNPHRHSCLLESKNMLVDAEYLFFHQYYFSIIDFSDELEKAGFSVITWYPYAVKAFLTREHPQIRNLWNSPFMRNFLKKKMTYLFNHAPRIIRENYGHMILFVAKPK